MSPGIDRILRAITGESDISKNGARQSRGKEEDDVATFYPRRQTVTYFSRYSRRFRDWKYPNEYQGKNVQPGNLFSGRTCFFSFCGIFVIEPLIVPDQD